MEGKEKELRLYLKVKEFFEERKTGLLMARIDVTDFTSQIRYKLWRKIDTIYPPEQFLSYMDYAPKIHKNFLREISTGEIIEFKNKEINQLEEFANELKKIS